MRENFFSCMLILDNVLPIKLMSFLNVATLDDVVAISPETIGSWLWIWEGSTTHAGRAGPIGVRVRQPEPHAPCISGHLGTHHLSSNRTGTEMDTMCVLVKRLQQGLSLTLILDLLM